MDRITSMDVTEDENFIVIGSESGDIILYDLIKNKQI